MGAVDVRLGEVQLPTRSQILGEGLQKPLHYARLHPLLEAAMARLVRRIPRGQIMPGRAGAEHPQNAIKYVTGTARRPPRSFACSMVLGKKRR